MESNKFLDKINKSRTLETSNKKGKGGRPSKSAEEAWSEKIFCNVTVEEKEKFDMSAANLGLSTAALLRMTLKKEGLI